MFHALRAFERSGLSENQCLSQKLTATGEDHSQLHVGWWKRNAEPKIACMTRVVGIIFQRVAESHVILAKTLLFR